MSNPVPTSLALGTISGTIATSPHNSNYAAVQTAVNALITAAGGGTTGQVLQAVDSTHVQWAYPPGYELNYTALTSVVNVASTTEASGTTIISPGAITFDGSAVMVEFFSPIVKLATVAGSFVVVSLFEGATQIGELCDFENVASAAAGYPAVGRLRFTPTAAAHTYTVTAFSTSLTGTPSIGAGVSGTGTTVPAFVRFTKV